MISFVAYGVPAPQGSMRAFNVKGRQHPVVTSDNPRTRPWKQTVLLAARDALCDRAPIDIAVRVDVQFYMPRPKSAPKSRRLPTKLPDLDKLVRAILDAMTDAGVWHDDSQVAMIQAAKFYAGGEGDVTPHGIPRAVIVVRLV
jgi:crossover junction endodeoxyribonuclease RusA